MNARQVVYFLTDQLVYFPSGVRSSRAKALEVWAHIEVTATVRHSIRSASICL